jgi:hypothetical protein
MDILWAAAGISLIVGFVFYVLAGHFRSVLHKQASTIRILSDRLQLLEQVEDPQFRQRVGQAAPPPLEQVFTFSFRLSDQFWRETLGLAEEDWQFVRSCGSFVGSVKLERWRSHTTAIITAVLPNRKTAAWQTRTLQYYPPSGKADDSLTLWELPLGLPGGSAKPSTLELSLRGNDLMLSRRELDVVTFFRTPLDLAQLSEFRSEEPTAAEHANGSANGNGNGHAHNAVPWRTFYSCADESRGIEWHLQVRDLCRKAEWERWRILESPAVPWLRNRV